jgi:hypothetical protein
MISDVLSDAIREIKRYQNEMPDSYEDIRPEIDTVTTVMNNLRAYLDNPNPEGRPMVLPSIDQLLFCPNCGNQHIDKPQPEKGWDNPPHRSHECQFCKNDLGEPFVWRLADVATNGVREIKTKGKLDQDAAPQYIRELRASVVLSEE